MPPRPPSCPTMLKAVTVNRAVIKIARMIPTFPNLPLGTDLVLLKPLENLRPQLAHFVRREPVLTARHRNQLRLITRCLQFLRQPHALIVRHDRVRIAMDTQYRGQPLAYVSNRRQFPSQLHTTWLVRNPGRSVPL